MEGKQGDINLHLTLLCAPEKSLENPSLRPIQHVSPPHCLNSSLMATMKTNVCTIRLLQKPMHLDSHLGAQRPLAASVLHRQPPLRSESKCWRTQHQGQINMQGVTGKLKVRKLPQQRDSLQRKRRAGIFSFTNLLDLFLLRHLLSLTLAPAVTRWHIKWPWKRAPWSSGAK